MLKFAKRGLIGMCMAAVLAITAVVPAFAAEVPEAPVAPATSNSIEVTSGDLQIVDVTDDGPQTKGSLSGYRSINVSGSGTGSFVVDVNGSYSPWAGCTLKTSGFSSNATIDISVCYGDDVKCTKTLGPNSEVKNIAMWNISAGGYTIKINVHNNSNTGNIQVWIY